MNCRFILTLVIKHITKVFSVTKLMFWWDQYIIPENATFVKTVVQQIRLSHLNCCCSKLLLLTCVILVRVLQWLAMGDAGTEGNASPSTEWRSVTAPRAGRAQSVRRVCLKLYLITIDQRSKTPNGDGFRLKTAAGSTISKAFSRFKEERSSLLLQTFRPHSRTEWQQPLAVVYLSVFKSVQWTRATRLFYGAAVQIWRL